MASQEGKIFSRSLDSLIFIGEDDDIYEWTCRIDKYFTLRDVPDEQRLSLVFYHLEGEALTWFRWLETNCLFTTWSNFLIGVKFRFRSSKFEEHEKSQCEEQEVNKVIVQETKEASEMACFVKATEQPLCFEIQDAKDAAGTSEVSQKSMLMDFQKGNEVEGLVCEGLICHVNDTKAQVQNVKSTGVCEYVHFFHLSGKHKKGIICQDGLGIDSSYKMNKHLSGCMIADVARRRSILKYYALAEVYKEVLSVHLEDMVVFEEGGNDTHSLITGLGPITTPAQMMSTTHMKAQMHHQLAH